MKRLAAAAVLLAACATTAPPPPERLAGCWIDRRNGAAVTMRWLPDRERPGVLRGDLLEYGEGAGGSAQHYTLEPHGEGWALCAHDEIASGPRCRMVAEGAGGSLEGGRVFIDAQGERLRISVHGEGAERVIFQGRRDGCD